MISDNPTLVLELLIVHFTVVVLFSRIIITRNEWTMDMPANTPVEIDYLETLAKIFIIPARQNQFIQGNISNNAPIRRIAIAMNTNYPFTGSYTENPVWYQQYNLRQIRILRGGQPIVDFDAADNCPFMLQHWIHWTFMMISFQFQLIISKTTKNKSRFDSDAICNWKMSLPRASWRTTEARA